MAHRRTTARGRFSYIINLFMVMMYAMGGIILLFWKMPGLPDTNRYIIAGALILYSAYRGIVLYRKFKDSRTQS